MRAAFVLVLLSAAACGTAVLGIDVQLATRACPGATAADSTRNPVNGVDKLHFVVTGDGLLPQTLDVDFAGGGAHLPGIPIGTNRRVTVEARRGTHAISRADSGRFDALGPGDVHLQLFLRAIDAFTTTGSADGSACTHLTVPRAGHAMTLLPDGRVLVSGGFTIDPATSRLQYHDEAEIFDPQTAAFTALPSSPLQRRAGHSAVAVSGPAGTAVLLAGGEGTQNNNPDGLAVALRGFEMYLNGAWTQVVPPASSPAREHQAAAVDLKTGSVLLAGGQTGPDSGTPTMLDTATFFAPSSGAVADVAQKLRAGPLTDAVAVARDNLRNGLKLGGVGLIGGRDGAGKVSTQISGLVFSESANDFVDDPAFRNLTLPSPRAHHIAARMRDDTVITAGGVTSWSMSPDYAHATAEVTLINPQGGTVGNLVNQQLSRARADSCTATLEDGSVMVVGGAWQDNAGLHSAHQVDLIQPDLTVRPPFGPENADGSLQAARHRPACVRLKDGSVLVTGGLQYPAGGTGAPVVLDSAEIYMPISAAP